MYELKRKDGASAKNEAHDGHRIEVDADEVASPKLAAMRSQERFNRKLEDLKRRRPARLDGRATKGARDGEDD